MRIQKSEGLKRLEKCQEIKGKSSKNTADVVEMLEMVLANQRDIMLLLKRIGGA